MDNFVSNIIIFPQLFHYNIISRLIDAMVCEVSGIKPYRATLSKLR